MRSTARAVIIKNKQLLLVTGHKADFYWTPGGKIELGESPIDTLLRELKEELNLKNVIAKHYISYIIDSQKVSNFLVESNENPIPSNEITNIIYYSKANYLNKDPKISRGLEERLIPELIKDGLL